MQSKPLCIIPARGGSKRIPRKNIIDFNGKPMIAWPIQAALESDVFDRVMVSTDDTEIADTARRFGADVPALRKPELADDFATTADVLVDVLKQHETYETACCLYPTAPLVEAADLQRGFDKLERDNADCVLSVTAYDFPPLRALERTSDNTLGFRWPEHELTRSQDLPELIHDAGMFYFFKTSHVLLTGRLLGGITLGVALPRDRAVDIDTPEDLELARVLHRYHLRKAC